MAQVLGHQGLATGLYILLGFGHVMGLEITEDAHAFLIYPIEIGILGVK